MYVRPRIGTVVHDSIHMYSNDNYRRTVRMSANEGTTEYLPQMICKQYGVDRGGIYSEEAAVLPESQREEGERLIGERILPPR